MAKNTLYEVNVEYRVYVVAKSEEEARYEGCQVVEMGREKTNLVSANPVGEYGLFEGSARSFPWTASDVKLTQPKRSWTVKEWWEHQRKSRKKPKRHTLRGVS